MLDPGKKKALIDWVNSLCVSECIESLQQLSDGTHFCKLVQLIDRDQAVDIDNVEARYQQVTDLLQNQYQVDLNGKLDLSLIKKADEFEISKVALLLLCVGVLSENNVLFVEPAMKLDISTQHEIREMAESVLQPDNRLQNLDNSYYRILLKPLDPLSTMSQPQMSSTPQTAPPLDHSVGNNTFKTPTQSSLQLTCFKGVPHTPVFSSSMQAGSSILGRFYSPQVAPVSPMSPVQQLVSSPGISSKIKLQQKEQRIKRLVRDLNSERHLRTELEADVKAHEEHREKNELQITELKKQLLVMRRQYQILMENGESVSADIHEAACQDSRQRNHSLLKELREAKDRNNFLETDNGTLSTENNRLKEQLQKMESFRQDCGKYKSTLDHLENLMSELNAEVREKAQQVATLTEVNHALQDDLKHCQELYKEQMSERKRAMETSVASEGGECLQEAIEKQLTGKMELLEQKLERTEKESSHWQAELVTVQNSAHQRVCELQKEVELSRSQAALSQQNLESERAQWEQIKHEITSTIRELQETKAQLERRCSNLVHEKSDLQQQAQAAVDGLQKKLAEAEQTAAEQRCKFMDEKEGMKKQLEEEEESHKQARAKAIDFEHQLMSAVETKAQLEDQLSETKHHVAQLQENLQLVTADNQTYATRVADLCDVKQIAEKREAELEALLKQSETKCCALKRTADEKEMKIVEIHAAEAELRQECFSLQQHKESLEQQVKQLQSDLSSKDDDFVAVREENKNLENCLEMQMCEKNNLLLEKNSLEKDLENMRVASSANLAEVKKQTENELLDFRKNAELQIGKLKNDLKQKDEEKQEINAHLEAENAKNCVLEAKLLRLSEDLSLTKNRSDMECSNQKKFLAEMEKEKCKFEELYSIAQKERNSENTHFSQQLTEATMKQQLAEKELSDLQYQMLKGSQERNQLQKRLEDEENEKAEWQSKSLELQQELMIHKQQSKLRIINIEEALQTAKAKNQQLQQNAAGSTDKIELLEQQLTTTSASFQQELTQAKKKNQELQNVVDNYTDKVELMEQELKGSKGNYEKTIQELRGKVGDAEDRRAKMEETLAEQLQKHQVFSMEQHKYFEKVDLLENALKVSKEKSLVEKKTFSAKLEDKESQLFDALSKISDLQSDLSQQKELAKKLKAELLLADDTLREKELMTTRLQETLNQTHSDATRQQEQYTNEMEASRCRELDLQSQLFQAEKDLADFKSHLHTLQQNFEQMAEELKSKSTQVNEFQHNLATSQEHNQLLEEKLVISRREVEALEEKLSTTQNRNTKLEDDLQSERQVLDETITQMKKELAEADQREQALEEENSRIREDLLSEKRHVEESKARLRITEESLQEVQRSACLEQDDLKDELLALQETKQQLLCNIETITSERKVVQNQLESITGHYQSAQNQLQEQASKLHELQTEMDTSRKVTMELEEKLTAATNEQGRLTAQMCVFEEGKIHAEAESSNNAQQVVFMGKELEQVKKQLQEKSNELISSLELIKVLQTKAQESENKSINFERTLTLAKETAELAQEELMTEFSNLQSRYQQLLDQSETTQKEMSEHLRAASNRAEEAEKSRSEVKAAKDQLICEQLQAKSYTQELEVQVKELRAKIINAEATKQDVQSESYEREKQLQRKVEELMEVENYKKQEVQHYKSRVELLEKKMAEAVEEVTSLQREYSNALARTDSLVTELCKEKDSHAQTQQHLQDELATARASRQETQDRLQQVEGLSKMAVQQLEYQLSAIGKEKETLTGKLYQSEEQLGIMRNANEEKFRKARNEIERLTSSNSHLVKEVESIQTHLQQEVNGHQAKINRMKLAYDEEIAKMEKAYNLLQDKCESLDEQKHDLKVRLEQFEDDYKQVILEMTQEQRKALQQAENKVDNVTAQMSQMMKEHAGQLEMLREQHKVQSQQDSSEWNQKYESVTASYHKVKELLRQRESDCNRLQDSCESYRDRCNTKSNQLIKQEQDLQASREDMQKLEKKYHETNGEVTNLKTQIREHEVIQKKLNAQIRTLEAQLELATRHIKERSTDSNRRKSVSTRSTKGRRETTFDVDIKSVLNESMEQEDSPMSLRELHIAGSPHKERTRRSSRVASVSSPDSRMDTDSSAFGPGKRAPSTFSLASSTDTAFDHSPPRAWATLTTRSSSALDQSLNQSHIMTRSRASVIGLPGVGVAGNRHNAVPRDISRMLVGMAEDEPEMFEFGRLSELQRRNTLCLPHLKSAYPVELQTRHPAEMSDDAVRSAAQIEASKSGCKESPSDCADDKRHRRKRSSSDGLPLDDSQDSSAKKRATNLLSDDSFESEQRLRRSSRTSTKTLNESLDGGSAKRKPSADNTQAQPLGSYQKPGPPTPGVTPGVTRVTPRRGRTTRHTPSPVVSTKKARRTSRKFTPLRRKTSNSENILAQGNVPNQEPTAFNIGFTPKKTKRLGRILGKKTQPQESQKKRPLGDNNTLRRA